MLDKPRQVRRAVNLLWMSLVVGFIVAFVDFDTSVFNEADGFLWEFVVMVFVMYLLFAATIYFVSRRKNWARILLLVLTVTSAVVVVIPWPGTEGDYWTLSTAVSQIGFMVLDAIAL